MRIVASLILSAAVSVSSQTASAQSPAGSPRLGVGPPSILKVCLDPGASMFAGPSARARECTRQYCSQPEFRAKVRTYAMSQPQSEADAEQALTCITRSEQDRRQY